MIIIISNKPQLAEDAITCASKETQFDTTFFEIYERSVDSTNCNRLIIVQPFKWHIWAINGSVYLLNESNKSCPINYTPSILVPTNKSDELSNQVFNDICINKVFNEITTSYTDNLQPIIINFDIETLQSTENKFTILDALNFLFTKYITMDLDTDPSKTDAKVTDGVVRLNRINILDQVNLTHTKLNHHTKKKLTKTLQKHSINKH